MKRTYANKLTLLVGNYCEDVVPDLTIYEPMDGELGSWRGVFIGSMLTEHALARAQERPKFRSPLGKEAEFFVGTVYECEGSDGAHFVIPFEGIGEPPV